MNINDIRISKCFRDHPPNQSKIEACRKYYREHCQRLDRDIVLNKDNVLVDGYVGYLVLKENGVTSFPVCYKGCTYRDRPTIYVYGYHTCDALHTEYVWRVTEKTIAADKIHPGSRVIVRTKNGPRVIIVTKTEKLTNPPLNQAIKKVIKCLEI